METVKRPNGMIVGIVERSPFVRSGEVTVRAKDKNVAFPDKATTHNMDRDFEVPHLTFKLTALAEGAIVDPQPTVLDRFIEVRAINVSTALWIGNGLPLARVADGIYHWTPNKPFTMRRGDAFSVCVDARDSFDIAFAGQRKRIDEIRVELSFEGELLRYASHDERIQQQGVEAPLG